MESPRKAPSRINEHGERQAAPTDRRRRRPLGLAEELARFDTAARR